MLYDINFSKFDNFRHDSSGPSAICFFLHPPDVRSFVEAAVVRDFPHGRKRFSPRMKCMDRMKILGNPREHQLFQFFFDISMRRISAFFDQQINICFALNNASHKMTRLYDVV